MRILKMLMFFSLILGVSSGADANLQGLYVICDEWPPYQVVENSRVTGFSTKIVEIVFKRMETTIEKIDVFPWKRAIKTIANGKADALFSANYTEDRTSFAFYPEEPIVISPWVMWCREEDELEFSSLDDLLGKKVGVVRGYSYTSKFWAFVKKHNIYEEVASDEINFLKLDSGRIDFVLAELGNGLHIVRTQNLSKIIPLKKNPVKTDGLYIIFHKKSVSSTFVDYFSDELKKLKQESLYEYLYDEYFGL